MQSPFQQIISVLISTSGSVFSSIFTNIMNTLIVGFARSFLAIFGITI